MSDTSEKKAQNIFVYGKSKINITGIASVDSFDENEISATTIDGERLFVEGSELIVTDVNLEEGYFEANGNFNGVFYSTQVKHTSLIDKIFRQR